MKSLIEWLDCSIADTTLVTLIFINIEINIFQLGSIQSSL